VSCLVNTAILKKKNKYIYASRAAALASEPWLVRGLD
jgi:hypothetical protein